MSVTAGVLRDIARQTQVVFNAEGGLEEFKIYCPKCNCKIDVAGVKSLSATQCPGCGEPFVIPQYFAGMQVIGFCDSAVDNCVCRAFHSVLNREVALKISKNVSGTFGANRLIRGAQTMLAVDHAGTVPLLHAGVWNNYPYTIMPWMERDTLKSVILLPAEERFTHRQSVNAMVRLAGVLDSAAQRGFGHYDINPGNILVSAEWAVYLTNFRQKNEYQEYADDPDGLIRYDGWRYFSNRVLRGETPDFSDDIFSFGVTLFEMLSGYHPFGIVATVRELRMQQEKNLIPIHLLRGIPAATAPVTALLQSMLDPKAGNRPTHAEILQTFETQLEKML